MEKVKRPHASNLVRWAADKPEVLVLSADLTSSCEADEFRDAYPDRFFSLGMAEQNMMGFAAGLAREGYFPFVHTFAVFITRRPYDQVAMSIAYPNLPVRLLGFLPGVTTPGGVTHQATDDVALMRAIPNMTILECGDATDVETILGAAHGVNGPVYLRMLRGEMPRLFDAGDAMRVGVPRLLSEGGDVLILSSGICTEEAMRASRALKDRGIGAAHMHITTLKPFDGAHWLDVARRVKYGVITFENHSIIGGLGSAVAEVMTEEGLGKKLVRIGLRDKYAHGASRPYLMKTFGLDAMALVRAVQDLCGKNLDIAEGELDAVDIIPVHSSAKAEAL